MTFSGFPTGNTGIKVTLGVDWLGKSGLSSGDVLILKRVPSLDDLSDTNDQSIFYTEDGSDDYDDDKNRLKIKFDSNIGVTTSAYIAMYEGRTNTWDWFGSVREKTTDAVPGTVGSVYTFKDVWSSTPHDQSTFSANTGLLATAARGPYNNDIFSAVTTGAFGDILVKLDGECIPWNESDHISYLKSVASGDADPTWNFVFENTSDGEVTIDTVTSPTAYFELGGGNQITAGTEIAAGASKTLQIIWDVSDYTANNAGLQRQLFTITTSRGTMYVHPQVYFWRHMSGMPDMIKLTLGTAWKAGNSFGLETTDVVVLKACQVKPSGDSFGCAPVYSENGTLASDSTKNRLKWTYASYGGSAYNYHRMYVSGPNTGTPGNWQSIFAFVKGNWSATFASIANYTFRDFWVTEPIWESSNFGDYPDVLDDTGAPFSFNNEMFTGFVAATANQDIQVTYNGVILTDDQGHMHLGTKVLSMVGSGTEPKQTVSITVENTGSEGVLVVNGIVTPPEITTDKSNGFYLRAGDSETVTLSINTNDVGYWTGSLKIESNDPDAEDEFTITILSASVTEQPSNDFIHRA